MPPLLQLCFGLQHATAIMLAHFARDNPLSQPASLLSSHYMARQRGKNLASRSGMLRATMEMRPVRPLHMLAHAERGLP